MKMKSHSNVKYICKKSFGFKYDLNRHQRTVHENEKPLQCEICQKSFGFTGHLNSHQKMPTKIKTHSTVKKIFNLTYLVSCEEIQKFVIQAVA